MTISLPHFVPLPQTKYSLTKQSSKRLLDWFERCELARCLALAAYREECEYTPKARAFYVHAKEAAIQGYSICLVLQGRGYSTEYLHLVLDRVAEDAANGN